MTPTETVIQETLDTLADLLRTTTKPREWGSGQGMIQIRNLIGGRLQLTRDDLIITVGHKSPTQPDTDEVVEWQFINRA